MSGFTTSSCSADSGNTNAAAQKLLLPETIESEPPGSRPAAGICCPSWRPWASKSSPSGAPPLPSRRPRLILLEGELGPVIREIPGNGPGCGKRRRTGRRSGRQRQDHGLPRRHPGPPGPGRPPDPPPAPADGRMREPLPLPPRPAPPGSGGPKKTSKKPSAARADGY